MTVKALILGLLFVLGAMALAAPVARADHCPFLTGPCARITGGTGGCAFPPGACNVAWDGLHFALLGGTGIMLVDGVLVDSCSFGPRESCSTRSPTLSWDCYAYSPPLVEVYTFTINGESDYDSIAWNPC